MKRKSSLNGGRKRMSASKLRTKRLVKSKSRPRKATSARRAAKSRKKAPKKVSTSRSSTKKIVRIMGQGQYTVDSKMLKKLNDLDDAIVELVSKERSDDAEFKKRLTELSSIVVRSGKPLDPKAIIQSDIILPSADLSVDEAKKLFRGEGVIPEL